MSRDSMHPFFAAAALVLLLLTAQLPAAEIKAWVSRSEVTLDETFQLSIASDDAVDGEPDFSALDDDFKIVNRSQSQNMQVINGRMSRTFRWNLMLQPKRTGVLKIPAFDIGSRQTDPIEIEVSEAAAATEALPGEEIFLTVDADRQTAYPGQQILLTVKLYRGVSIKTASLTQPQTNDPDILIRKLGEDEQYTSQIEQRRYSVVERRYALFPSRSGRLELAPLRFEGEVMASRRRNKRLFSLPFDNIGQPGKVRRVQSRALTLEILPRPQEAAGKPWLPSSNLELVEHWGGPQSTLRVGEPVTRTLMLRADGLTSAQLPELEIAIPPGLKRYPDQPELTDQVDKSGITGVRQSKIAIIPNRAGSYTLPAIELEWWNVVAARMERASIPQRTIEVVAAPTAEHAPSQPDRGTEAPAVAGASTQEPAPAGVPSGAASAAALAWLLGGGWLVTLLAWWYSRRRKPGRPRETSTARPPMIPPTTAAIRSACLDNDAHAAQRALLAWARQRWPEDPPRSLARVSARFGDAGIGDALLALERSLYAPGAPAWEGGELWRRLQQAQPVENAPAPVTGNLAPLHPR